MNLVEHGNSFDAPIICDSGKNNDDNFSLTSQIQRGDVWGNDTNLESVGYAEGDVNGCSNVYDQPAKRVRYGENDQINAVKVPFSSEHTRNNEAQRFTTQSSTKEHELQNEVQNESSLQPPTNWQNLQTKELNYPSPQSSTNRHSFQNNVPDEALEVQNEVCDSNSPMRDSGLRRSSRKRNAAIYNENLLANKLPRLTRHKDGSHKKKQIHCLKIKASNHFAFDGDGVIYENGHQDEIQADEIVNYVELHRNNITAEDAPLRASTQPPEELPSGKSPIQNMATADANVEGNDGDIRKKPSQAGKLKAQSSCSENRKCGDAAQVAPEKQSSRMGIEIEGREPRALRMRAANAGAITKPCASEKAKPRTRSSGNKRHKREDLFDIGRCGWYFY